MPSVSERPPRRCYELEIKIGGDTWDDVMRHLAELASHIPEHGLKCNSVSGGYSANHTVTCLHFADMTHDKYFEELGAYMKRCKESTHA